MLVTSHGHNARDYAPLRLRCLLFLLCFAQRLTASQEGAANLGAAETNARPVLNA